eukprot:jgi/Chrpa1/696/Chrysochromulina_OHIO_Genome00012244-RA
MSAFFRKKPSSSSKNPAPVAASSNSTSDTLGTFLKTDQEIVFTRWWNMHLMQIDLSVDDLTEDIKSGVLPIRLLEVLSNSSLGKIHENPEGKLFKMLENQNVFLTWLKKSDMKLVGIGAEDLVGGNKTLVLGLTWTLILRYEIHKFDTTHQELLNWVKSVGEKHRVAADGGWSTMFNDGLLISAIVLDAVPGAIDLEAARRMEPFRALSYALDAAEELLGAPPLLNASDFNGKTISDRSVILYTAKLKQRHDVVAAQQSYPGGQATLAAKARVAEAKEEQLAAIKLQAVQRGNVVRKETDAEKERLRLLADAEARRQRVTAEMAAREAAREAALREAARAAEEESDLDDADADSLWMEEVPAAAAAEAAAAKAAAMEADAAKAAAAAFYKAAEEAEVAKAQAARAAALRAEEEAAALKVQSLVRGHQARNAQEESRRIASLGFYVAEGAYDEARKLAVTLAEEATIQQAEEEAMAGAKRAAWAKEAEEEWKRKKAAKEAKEAAEKEAAEKAAEKAAVEAAAAEAAAAKKVAEEADVAKALAARAAALKAEEEAAAAKAAAEKVLELQAEEEAAAAKRAAWAKEAEEEWKRKKAAKEAKEAAEKEAAEKAAEKAAAEAAAAGAEAAKAAAKAAAEEAAAEETISKRQKTKIERQPEGKLLKSASSRAP